MNLKKLRGGIMDNQSLKLFICKYLNVKESGILQIENIIARDEIQAFQLFLEKRRKQAWSLPDIFVHSKVIILNELTGKEFRLDTRGELIEKVLAL